MPTSPTNASFYADFKSLSALKLDAKTDQQKALRAAAQEFESLFTSMMLKSMRSATSSIGGTDNSSEMDLYQSMFDQQIATQMSKGKGLGLADMLVQQMTRSGLVKGVSGAAASGASEADSQQTQNVAAKPSVQTAAKADTTSSTTQSSAADFIQSLWPHAQAAAQQLGVDPATLVAHAALETGWGKHVPCNADGSSSFNLFGIKAGGDWSGQSTGASTLEFEQGVAVKRVERFKSYDSAAECFADYAGLLSSSSRFGASRNSGSSVTQFAQALQQGGYATDPQYAAKLQAVAGSVRSVLSSLGAQVASTQADT